jgi:hypothetical protein
MAPETAAAQREDSSDRHDWIAALMIPVAQGMWHEADPLYLSRVCYPYSSPRLRERGRGTGKGSEESGANIGFWLMRP